MTKKKKRLLIVLISFLCLFAMLFSYSWFAPYGRHEVLFEEPLSTNTFIPLPDAIAYVKGGIAIEVSEEKRNQIYEAFVHAFEQKPSNLQAFGSHKKKDFIKYVMTNTNIEFRYEQRRNNRRAGRVYDAILFSFEENGYLVPIYCLDGKYLLENSLEHFWFKEKSYLAEFEKTIKKIV